VNEHAPEFASLAVRAYKRIMYLMAEGFTEEQAEEMTAKELGLDG
jgi:uncharacterized protein YoaH (UPF0181 family)